MLVTAGARCPTDIPVLGRSSLSACWGRFTPRHCAGLALLVFFSIFHPSCSCLPRSVGTYRERDRESEWIKYSDSREYDGEGGRKGASRYHAKKPNAFCPR